MNKNMQKQFEKLSTIWSAADQIIEQWDQKKNGKLLIPDLISMLAVKFEWDKKQILKYDPFVRDYIRDHDTWCIDRGAKGGVGSRSEKEERAAKQIAKAAIKDQVKADLQKKLQQLSEAPNFASYNNPNDDDDDFEIEEEDFNDEE